MGLIIKILLGLVLVVIIAAVAAATLLPAIIPSSVYQTQLESRLEKVLAREADFDGPIRLRTFPNLTVSAEDVSIFNPDGFTDDLFARLERLDVQVRLWPLLSGRLEIKAFVVEGPALNLERLADGRTNYEFGTGAASAPAETQEGDTAKVTVDADLILGDVRLVDAGLTYRDGRTGESYEIEDLNLTAKLTSLKDPAEVKGSVRYQGEDFVFDVKTDEPAALIEGRRTGLSAAIGSDLVKASATVEIERAPGPVLSGEAAVDTPSLRRLAAWAGSPLPDGEGLEGFAMSGEFEVSSEKAALPVARLRLDEIRGEGALAIDLRGARPNVTGSLALSTMDLRPYLPAPADGDPSSDDDAPGGGGAEPAGVPPWSEEEIDLSPLTLVDADLTLKTQAILLPTLTVDGAEISARLQGGVLQADLDRVELYEGRATGALRVNAAADTPDYRITLDAKGFELQPLLRESAGFERLSGTAQADVDIRTRGRSPKAIASGLTGRADVRAEDGTIVGFNLPLLARQAETLFSGAASPRDLLQNLGSANALTGDATDFSDLETSLVFDRGVGRVTAMRLLTPYARVLGEGVIDFGGQRLDLLLNPYFGERGTGNVRDDDFKPSPITVSVKGPWSKVAVTPNITQAAQQAVGRQLQNVLGEDNPVGGLVGGLLGAEPKGSDEPQSAEDAAVGAIFGLLGEARRRQREKEEKKKDEGDGGGR